MTEEQSRLIWDWVNEKGNVESFLTEPLEWVASELEKACKTLPFGRILTGEDVITIETLIDIVRFINTHRNLLTNNG